MKLLIATRNAHKLREIREIFDLPGIEIVGADEVPGLPEVEEDGATFEANARKKAVVLALASGLWALADDSGLEVDALGGAPGVFSARYAGEPADYAANNRKLLEELRDEPDRRARFRCAMALAGPDGECRVVEGACEGRMARGAMGQGGFGYDPLFVPEGYTCTFADMPAESKNRISHRGVALMQARSAWGDMLQAVAAGVKTQQPSE